MPTKPSSAPVDYPEHHDNLKCERAPCEPVEYRSDCPPRLSEMRLLNDEDGDRQKSRYYNRPFKLPLDQLLSRADLGGT